MLLVLALASVPFSYDGALRPGQTLTVRDINGEVRVHAGDRLSIRATKHADRSDPNGVAIKVENRADGIVVCVRYPPEANRGCDDSHGESANNNDTAVDFDITVPHGANVNAASVNGSVDVTGDGTTSVASVNGNVRAEGRDVRSARTVNGSVRVRVVDATRGELSAKTVNGSIEVALPHGSGVALKARTVTGDISAEGVEVKRPRYGPGASADATLGDGARKLDLKTVNGSITVTR